MTACLKASSELATFNFEGTDLRVADKEGQLWFIAADIAVPLAYRDAPNLTRILDEDERGTHTVSTPSGDQEMTTISEPGLYRAIMQRRVTKKLTPEMKSSIERFQRWVYHEVLPTIRMTGSYSHAGVTVSNLDTSVRSTIGGIVKSCVGVAVREQLKEILPSMIQTGVYASLADQALLIRRGDTSSTVWDRFGLPKVRGRAQWLGHRLAAFGCALQFGERADIAGKAVRLFDPDKANFAMNSGLLLAARKWAAERQGQGKLNLDGKQKKTATSEVAAS